jgi:RNA polymerase sigma factor for flagellar operon FliA
MDLLAHRERVERVAAAVRRLPERLQHLLGLYYEEELTYREIADLLGVSEPRVCQLHGDAMRKLREVLRGDGE